jgi:hypothetical protein
MLMSFSSYSMYYHKKIKQESPLSIEIMHLIDAMYIEQPEFGPLRMHAWIPKLI